MIKTYNDYLKESIDFIVDIEEPFNTLDEHFAASNFSIIIEPIKIKEVNGDILEDFSNVEIIFTNDEKIEYNYRINKKAILEFEIKFENGTKVINMSKYLDKYLGSTGTLIGDLSLIYKDFKLSRIS